LNLDGQLPLMPDLFLEIPVPGAKTPTPAATPEVPVPGDASAGSLASSLLPKLLPPILAGNISLEELVKAVGMETRQITTKTGLETLKAKAEEIKEKNDEKIKEIQTQLEKMREREKLSPFLKAFKWIGMIVGAIASVASIVAGAVTGNPLLIAGGAVMLAMTVNSIVSEASDGKYSIGQGVAELAKKCGASEEVAQWIGMGVEIAITIVGACLSFGAGGASAAAQAASKAAQVMGKVAQVASLVSGLVTMGQGGLKIADSVYSYQISTSKAAQKDLEAILARLAEAQDVETKFMETIMKRAEEMLAAVKEIVEGNMEAQTAVLAGQTPAMA
jgi:hypothetical protein